MVCEKPAVLFMCYICVKRFAGFGNAFISKLFWVFPEGHAIPNPR